jgi:RND family efflux transporter MFP subunit
MKTLCFILAVIFSSTAFAGAGHDHGHDHNATPTIPNANAPQRLPDGSVFLPKPSQHFIKVRTQLAKQETLPKTLRLNGQVIANSDAIGKLQALQSGRLDAVNDQLPQVGDTLKKGQKLATITLAKDAQENTNQSVETADLQEQLNLARLEYQRLHKLGNLIPARDVDIARANVNSLKARLAAFKRGGKSYEVLRAPLSGIVTAVYATDGQAVQAGETLLEVMTPTNLLVEALSFDPALPDNIASATLVFSNQTIPLNYQGSTQRLRQQALPLRFSVASDTAIHLADGLPVQVLVQTKQTFQGVSVPAEALARNTSNQDVVWIKTAPEHFKPQVVQYQPLDGQRVMITAGLQGNERVVIQATTLINQIR